MNKHTFLDIISCFLFKLYSQMRIICSRDFDRIEKNSKKNVCNYKKMKKTSKFVLRNLIDFPFSTNHYPNNEVHQNNNLGKLPFSRNRASSLRTVIGIISQNLRIF